jgi:hypothetical protein
MNLSEKELKKEETKSMILWQLLIDFIKKA